MPLPTDPSPSPFQPSSCFSERLRRLRNYQSHDFWAMLFARPLTILFLLPLADLKWVTPDRITWASLVAKAAGIAALAAWPSWCGGVVAAILVNLGLVLDNMDGTLARYRGASSFMGYYLDKAVDALCLCAIFGAVALRQYRLSNEVLDAVLPLAGYCGASVAAYCKWVADKVETDAELAVRLSSGTLEEFARVRVNQNPSYPPPERSLADWIRFFGEAFKSILYFNEVDIFFFLALALVLDEAWIFTRVMCPIYALGAVFGPVFFYFKLRRAISSDRSPTKGA